MNGSMRFAAAGLLSAAVFGAGCDQTRSEHVRAGSARGETMQATGQPGVGADHGTGTTASGEMTGTATTGAPGAAGTASTDTHHGGPGSPTSADAHASVATTGHEADAAAALAGADASAVAHATADAGTPGQTASNAGQGPGGIDQAAVPADAVPADADAAQLAAAEDKKDAKHDHDDAHHAHADAWGDVKPSAAAPKEMQVTGTVKFAKAEHGVKVMVDLKGLTPNGKHGFHIHEKGDLSDPKLMSVGGHFNPAGKKHGGPEGEERHGGDLGNITADDKGNAKATLMAHGVTIDGEKDGILGRAVIVHAKADDQKTDPAGNAGDRIAGGKIEKAKEEKK